MSDACSLLIVNKLSTHCVFSLMREVQSFLRNFRFFLGLIGFCIVFGMVLARMGDDARVMIQFFDVLNEVVMRIVILIMW